MTKREKRFLTILIVGSLIISLPIFFYYSQVYFQKLHLRIHHLYGYYAYVCSLMISVPLVYFTFLFWDSRENFGETFRPSVKKIALFAVVCILTPAINLSFISLLLGIGFLGFLKASTAQASIDWLVQHFLFAVFPAYLATCLSLSQNVLFGKVLWRILLYFVGCFGIITLVAGVGVV